MSRSNIKYQALIDDPTIADQQWTCISFVSPEDLIQKRELYNMNQFLFNDVNKSIGASAEHMAKEINLHNEGLFNDLVNKYSKSSDPAHKELVESLNTLRSKCQVNEEQFVNRCSRKYFIDQDEISDRYKVYCSTNYQELLESFNDKFDEKRCSIRGFKVRGNFKEYEKADEHADAMRKLEPGVAIAVAPVGAWVPWDADPDAVQNSEYMLSELNTMMKKRQDQDRARDKMFKERVENDLNTNQSSNPTRDRIREKLKSKKIKAAEEQLDRGMPNEQDDTEQLSKSKKKRLRKQRQKENA